MEKDAAKRLNEKKTKALYTFGWSFSIGMTLLTAVGIWRSFPEVVLYLTGILAVYHIVLFIFLRKALFPTYLAVTFAGRVIGSVLSFLVFMVIYYSFFTCISVILRICGKDVIKNNSSHPHWIDIPIEGNNPKRIEKLY